MEILSPAILLLVIFSLPISRGKPHEPQQYFCKDHTPQKTIDLEMLMGKWHIVEIVHHLTEDQLMGGFVTLDVCPSIFLQQETATNLRLVWTEPKLTVNYIMKKASSGLWISSGPHNDTLVEHNYFYNAYTGTIEVMKAVGSHAVLTFCKSEHHDSQLFSIVLARQPVLPRQELRGVNHMLRDRGLQLVLVKETCRGYSGAIKTNIQFGLALLVMIIAKFIT